MRNLRSLYFRHYFFSFFHFVSWDETGETSLVQALHDFRHNCTPTWLFIASGMIDYWWCHHWQWLMCNSKVSDPVLPLGQLLDLVGSNPSTVPRSKASNRKLQNCRGSNISVCIPSTDTLSNMGNDWAHPSGIIIHQRHEKDACRRRRRWSMKNFDAILSDDPLAGAVMAALHGPNPVLLREMVVRLGGFKELRDQG